MTMDFIKTLKKKIGFPDYHFYPTHSPETTPQKIKVDRARFGARPNDLAKRLEPIEKKYGMRLIYERY